MKYLLFFFILILVSCTPTKTEMWFNKDESGHITSTYDLGEMIDMVGGVMNEIGEETTEEGEDDFFGEDEVVDSTMVLFDVMPDSVKQLYDNPEIYKNISMRLKGNKAENEMIMMMKISFDNNAHMAEVMAAMDELNDPADPTSPGFGMLKPAVEIDYKKGVISIPVSAFLGEMMEGEDYDEMAAEMDSIMKLPEDDMSRIMMESMFGGSTTTTVHAPSKITYTNKPDATVKKKDFTFTLSTLDAMRPENQDGIVIKFKPKK